MIEPEGYLIPFSHLDLYWLGRKEECLSRGNRVISRAIEVAEQDETFRFSLEIMTFVDNFAKTHPERLDELKKLVSTGKIELGARWSGIHQNMSEGEEIVRNILYAKKHALKVFGYEPRVSHPGDIPGCTPQYPQILCKCGVPYLVITRLGPKEIPLYRWKGLDSSAVTVYNALKGYAWGWKAGLHNDVKIMGERDFEEQIREVASKTPAPVLIHWGIDLTLPTKKLCDNVRMWNERSDVKLKIATLTQYFEKVKDVEDLPIIEGEIPNCWSYIEPTFANIIPLHVRATNLLLAAEKLASVNYAYGFSEYPTEKLKESWKRILEVLDHNYAGQGADDTVTKKENHMRLVISTAEEIIRSSLSNVAEKVEIKDRESNPIVVFNPLSWKRTDVVLAHVTFHGDIAPDAFHGDITRYQIVDLVDGQGRSIPFQVVDEWEGVSKEMTITFIAEDVPPIGYKTYYVVPAEDVPPMKQTCKTEKSMGKWRANSILLKKSYENDFYRVTVDELTGKLTVFDKELNRTVLEDACIVGVEEELDNLFLKDLTTGRTFENRVKSIELAENGPVMARLLIRGEVLDSPTVQQLVLYKSLRRMEMTNTIDWEGGKPVRIQQLFPFKFSKPRINYGIPYGANSFENVQPGSGPERADELSTESWFRLREMQKWMDIGNGKLGVTVASDHRQVEVDGSAIRANMIRGTRVPFTIQIKDGRKEFAWYCVPGRYTFKYSIRCHGGDWKAARAYIDGWEVANPLIALSVNDPETPKMLPSEMSFCEVSGEGIIVTVLKKAEDDEAVILRFFETTGEPTNANVDFFFKVARVFEVDLMEREMADLPDLKLEVRPFEIRTIKLKTINQDMLPRSVAKEANHTHAIRST